MTASVSTGPTAFIGRQAELATLREQLAAAQHGRGSIVLLAGEPGIGKTRLAEELATEARERGFRVAWGRCYEGEGAPAFWPWVEVLRASMRGQPPEALRAELGLSAPELARLVAEIGVLLPDLPAPPVLESAQARFRLFDAATAYLTGTAGYGADGRAPRLVILDDLHWADTPSLLLLEFLARDLADAPLLVLGAYRDSDVQRGHPLATTLGELARHRYVARLILTGLDESEAALVLEGAMGAPPAPALVARLADETTGNPLFLTELARLLAAQARAAEQISAARGGLSPALPVPQSVREVIGRRLNRLSAACQRMLVVAAVVGREFGVAALGRATELDGRALLALLEEAEAAALIAGMDALGRYAFSHDLIREALYADVSAARRVQLHRQVGRALEGLWGDDPEHVAELAYHFCLGAPAADADKAVAYARRAGDQARAGLAYEEAAAHYARALEALALQTAPDGALRAELLISLGSAQQLAGQLQAAKETFRRAAQQAQRAGVPALLAEAALGYAAHRVTGAVDATEVALLQQALDELEAGDSVLRVRLLSQLTAARYFAQAWDELEALNREVVAMARRLGDPAALAAALTPWHWSLRTPEDPQERLAADREMVQLAEAARDRQLAARAHWRCALDCLELGDFAEADRAMAAHNRLATELRDAHRQWFSDSYVAMQALLRGRFEEAERLAGQVLAVGQRIQHPDAALFFGVHLFLLRREQGRLAELATTIRDFVAQYPALVSWRAALARISVEVGDWAAARRELADLAKDDFAGLPRDLTWLPLCALLAEVCAALGDAPHATPLYEALRPHAGRVVIVGFTCACYGAVDHFLGLLAAALVQSAGDHASSGAGTAPGSGHPPADWWGTAIRHFEDALALHARLEAPALAARTRYAYAALLLTRGGSADRQRAAALLEQAAATARELGMVRLAGDAATLLTRLAETSAAVASQARPVYPDRLTVREVEVLRLLAAGKSNQEIAAHYVLSRRTVERHIANLYSKIGAHSKAEATTYAFHHGLV